MLPWIGVMCTFGLNAAAVFAATYDDEEKRGGELSSTKNMRL